MSTLPPVAAASSPLADPRVETLVAWAQTPEVPLDEGAGAAIEALEGALPRADAAAALALAATAAYTRVPGRGLRDAWAGERLVGLIARLGEPGARELVRLRERVRERVHYEEPGIVIGKALAGLERELGIPLGELEDAFGGPTVDADLTLRLSVGPFEALVTVREDLRRVRTSWTGASGKPLRSRPARVVDHPDELALLQVERRRVQAHLTDLRARLEDAMSTGRSWSLEQWAVRMFADPLRATLARRLVWRFEGDGTERLAVPREEGLEDAVGGRVDLPPDANVTLWHPAEDPDAQRAWQRRATNLDFDQPIDQIWREVTLTDADSNTLSIADGVRVEPRIFRGFLLRQGWEVSYLNAGGGDPPQVTHELQLGGPIADLELDTDYKGVTLGPLGFRSVQGRELDARKLPPALVSEAARDVLAAVKAAT